MIMRQLIYLLFCLSLTLTTIVAQEIGIEMTYKGGKRVRTIHEGSTIKVRTLSGNKFKGKIDIIDSKTIGINGEEILLSDIKSIRRKPLAVKIVKGFFIAVGVVAIGVPIIIGSSGLTILLSATLAAYSNLIGFTVPEFFVQTRSGPKWTFNIIL